MCISVCARHIPKLLRQAPLPVAREMSAHSESGASLKLTTVKKGKSQRFIRTFKVVAHVVLPSFYIFLYFVTAVDVVICFLVFP